MKHPTVDIPNIGPMDHAWDVLGAWTVEVEVPFRDEPVSAVLQVRSWTEAELEIDPWSAAATGLPGRVNLERASRVHLTDAGGGALQWVLFSSEDRWTIQATMWPGALHLFVQDADDPDEHLFRATGHRPGHYYASKYPVATN